MYFRYTSSNLLGRISVSVSSYPAVIKTFPVNNGDVIQYTVFCAGMPEYKTEETVMAAHAVGHDCVRGRYSVLLSHHRR